MRRSRPTSAPANHRVYRNARLTRKVLNISQVTATIPLRFDSTNSCKYPMYGKHDVTLDTREAVTDRDPSFLLQINIPTGNANITSRYLLNSSCTRVRIRETRPHYSCPVRRTLVAAVRVVINIRPSRRTLSMHLGLFKATTAYWRMNSKYSLSVHSCGHGKHYRYPNMEISDAAIPDDIVARVTNPDLC